MMINVALLVSYDATVLILFGAKQQVSCFEIGILVR